VKRFLSCDIKTIITDKYNRDHIYLLLLPLVEFHTKISVVKNVQGTERRKKTGSIILFIIVTTISLQDIFIIWKDLSYYCPLSLHEYVGTERPVYIRKIEFVKVIFTGN